jgi:hypothetical protein
MSVLSDLFRMRLLRKVTYLRLQGVGDYRVNIVPSSPEAGPDTIRTCDLHRRRRADRDRSAGPASLPAPEWSFLANPGC